MNNHLLITIDGPAGAGKSSVARRLARELGVRFLDTGAMYRTVTWVAMQQGVDLNDTQAIADLAMSINMRFDGSRVLVDEQDVSEQIRLPEVTEKIRFVADNPAARQVINQKQREFVAGEDCVTEGRDQGTEVFPDASCKIFLTASARQRAQRRQDQLAAIGTHVPLEQLLDAQNRRDRDDESRPVGRLAPADDAIVVNTDRMSQQQVVGRLLEIVNQCRNQRIAGT